MRSGLRILLSEGSSTSARQAVTALGRLGHRVEICDPDTHCLARFSKWTHAVHRCPGMGNDPIGFLDFVEDLLAKDTFDVVLPIHEQGYLFAHGRERLARHAAIALPEPETYMKVLSKAHFAQVLDAAGVPQPATTVVHTRAALSEAAQVPCVLKLAVATAHRGVWIVRSLPDLTRALTAIKASGALDRGVIVQSFVDGSLGHAQAVFDRGRLVGLHGYTQIAAGAGGGPARKRSSVPQDVAEHMATLGRHIGWHGALSADYMCDRHDGVPKFIDGNPRLVEPMSAAIAGTDLAGLLVEVSLDTGPEPVAPAADGVQTHLALQALLGIGQKTESRRAVLDEALRLATGRAPYGDSAEELTPIARDLRAVLPVAAAAIAMLVRPSAAYALPVRGWGRHLLRTDTLDAIEAHFGTGKA